MLAPSDPRYRGPSQKLRGTKRPRYTRMDICESNRLRFLTVRYGWPPAEIAAVVGCSPEHIKKWQAEAHILAPDYCERLRARWPKETLPTL